MRSLLCLISLFLLCHIAVSALISGAGPAPENASLALQDTSIKGPPVKAQSVAPVKSMKKTNCKPHKIKNAPEPKLPDQAKIDSIKKVRAKEKLKK